MKKNVTYYYDEDDAVPIKKRKKAVPLKKEMPEKEEPISFTPRKNISPSAKKTVEEKPAEVKKASEAKAAPTVKKAAETIEAPKIQIAEIPYNKEYGNPVSVVPSKVEAETKRAEKAVKKAPPAPPKMEIEELFPAEEKVEKKRASFGLSFIIYIAVLLILSVFCILYVRGLLIDYEAAQPENIVMSKIEEMTKAAEKGKIGSAVSLAEVMEKFSPTEKELKEFTDDLLANGQPYPNTVLLPVSFCVHLVIATE